MLLMLGLVVHRHMHAGSMPSGIFILMMRNFMTDPDYDAIRRRPASLKPGPSHAALSLTRLMFLGRPASRRACPDPRSFTS